MSVSDVCGFVLTKLNLEYGEGFKTAKIFSYGGMMNNKNIQNTYKITTQEYIEEWKQAQAGEPN